MLENTNLVSSKLILAVFDDTLTHFTKLGRVSMVTEWHTVRNLLTRSRTKQPVKRRVTHWRLGMNSSD